MPGEGDCIEEARAVISAAEKLLGRETIQPGFGDDDLASASTALAAVRHMLGDCLTALGTDEPKASGTGRLAALLVRSDYAQTMILDGILARRDAKVRSAKDAIGRLRESRSTAQLVERAATEAHHMGFDRILFSRIDHGMWLASSAYATADERFANTLVQVGLAHPRKLTGILLESEMVRRRAPMVVRDPQSNPRVYTELVSLTETNAYVAAPVLAWGEPIGLVHADRQAQSAPVDESDRDILGMFAEGLGIAFERNLLLDKLKTVQDACNDYARGVNAVADDSTIAVMDSAALPDELEPPVARERDGDSPETLTRREWEVLRCLALGKTNAQIAISLFVAEGTVKTHVKHVLRKLGAANRTDAAAKYHRMLN